jgi:hypothetical protein
VSAWLCKASFPNHCSQDTHRMPLRVCVGDEAALNTFNMSAAYHSITIHKDLTTYVTGRLSVN